MLKGLLGAPLLGKRERERGSLVNWNVFEVVSGEALEGIILMPLQLPPLDQSRTIGSEINE
jgi:hypothetical protein